MNHIRLPVLERRCRRVKQSRQEPVLPTAAVASMYRLLHHAPLFMSLHARFTASTGSHFSPNQSVKIQPKKSCKSAVGTPFSIPSANGPGGTNIYKRPLQQSVRPSFPIPRCARHSTIEISCGAVLSTASRTIGWHFSPLGHSLVSTLWGSSS